MIAVTIAVKIPILAITAKVMGASEYKILLRAIIYIPAVTIVAACINADTGVGPAIASGNHVYKGICALLPTAPTNNNKVIPTIAGELRAEMEVIIPLESL